MHLARTLLLASCLALVGSLAWAGSHESAAAEAGQGQPGSHSARVAGGTSVALVDSSRSAAEWAERRPGYRALRPKKH